MDDRHFLPSILVAFLLAATGEAGPLPGTDALTAEGDLAAQMVAGMDRYLMRELARAPERRLSLWKPDDASPDAFARLVEAKRARLRQILGAVDKRLPVADLEYVATTSVRPLVAEEETYTVHAVRWPVFDGVDAEGLLLEPRGKVRACVVALPDADWTPEMLVGLSPGVPKESQFARRLAENGCRVLVPTLIDRQDTWSGNPRITMTNQPHREFIYRMAFEMGRHIIGYEVQKVHAAVDWFARDKDHPPVGVIGYGEGGLLALSSAALDPRIQATVVSGYFGARESVWQEPIYRNVWGLLTEFGDAELALLVAPRRLIIETSRGPEIAGPPSPREGRKGAAPGKLVSPDPKAAASEALRVTRYRDPNASGLLEGLEIIDQEVPGSEKALRAFLRVLGVDKPLRPDGPLPHDARTNFDLGARQHRQFDQLVEHTQRLYRESETRRGEFWAKADASTPEKWQASCGFYRDYFWEEVIGKLPAPRQPPSPRTRPVYDEPKWKGYEVMLDLDPDLFAYGILLVPKDLREGERRPVVVCQHGGDGRPQDVVNPAKKTPYYNSFGAQLADRGFIVYAPQNCYLGGDSFRVLQRKGNPLKVSLFSFIARQHERTLEWLAKLPFVDRDRVALYGLSWGGKTAMRVPALLPGYRLSICSGDFNEWIRKNVSLDFRYTYMYAGEYEMFEFNLGNTFNYAEMAALIAPRPFMVERGHDDAVGLDEWVAYEYAKVRRLYSRLGLADKTAIEFFAGGHEINGKGTFEFLEKHLSFSNGRSVKTSASAVTPREVIRPFNGRDLSGLSTWLKKTGRDDPQRVFRVENGMIRCGAEDMGYIATQDAYQDFHLIVEYKWGERNSDSKSVRNSGILLHGVGPDGSEGGVWMTSIECQLAQGCEGDLIVIRGKSADGEPYPATITSETSLAEDDRTRWQEGGKPTLYSGRQFWWSKHQPFFEELIDTRGKNDVASPLGEWTKVECLCRGSRITIRVNGVTVNECFDARPAAGKVLLQTEGHEIYFRNFELRPLP